MRHHYWLENGKEMEEEEEKKKKKKKIAKPDLVKEKREEENATVRILSTSTPIDQCSSPNAMRHISRTQGRVTSRATTATR